MDELIFGKPAISPGQYIDKVEHLIGALRAGALSKEEFFLALAEVDLATLGDSESMSPGEYRLEVAFREVTGE